MLKFDDCFENDIVNFLKDKIKSIRVENCVDSFIKYVEDAPEDEDMSFETKYRKELYFNYEQVILRTKLKKYQNKSKEEILEGLKEYMYDIDSSIRSDAENSNIREVFDYWPVEDADAYDVIKDYMTEILNDVVEKANKTSKQKEINDAKRQYDQCKENIERYSKMLEESKAKLAELGVNIEKE